jgi:hypothetical protein
VKRYSKRAPDGDIFKSKYIFFLIHNSTHFELAVVFVEDSMICYYDPLLVTTKTRDKCAHNLHIQKTKLKAITEWKTIYITGGKKDKISKGDIAGLFFKQGNLTKDQLGPIELKLDCAYVAVLEKHANSIVKLLNNSKLKNKKIRVSIVE